MLVVYGWPNHSWPLATRDIFQYFYQPFTIILMQYISYLYQSGTKNYREAAHLHLIKVKDLLKMRA